MGDRARDELAGSRTVWRVLWVPATVAAVVLGFALLIWLGRTGFDTVVAETHEIVGRNLDSAVRISEIGSRLQKISATSSRPDAFRPAAVAPPTNPSGKPPASCATWSG